MVEKTISAVAVPAGISIKLENGHLVLEKSGKKVSKDFSSPLIETTFSGQDIAFKAINARRKTIAVLQSYVAHTLNLIKGLEEGFTYKLAIVNSHFPMSVKVKDKIVEISNYLGEKNPRYSNIVGPTKVEIKGKDITVTGNLLEEVSQTAANMEKATRNTVKDQRTFQDGIYITSKGVDVL